jgi:hypothetical protein
MPWKFVLFWICILTHTSAHAEPSAKPDEPALPAAATAPTQSASARTSKPKRSGAKTLKSGQLSEAEKKARLKKIADAEKVLLEKYVGWEEEIKEMTSIVRNQVKFPKIQNRPAVIPMFTLPGSGKTTLIQDFIRLMEWQGTSVPVFIRKGMLAIPFTPLIQTAKPHQGPYGFQGVMYADEIQKLPDNVDELLKKQPRDPKNLTQGDLTFMAAQEAAKAERDHKAWDILGNGVYAQSSDYHRDTYVSWLQGVQQQLEAHDNIIASHETALKAAEAQVASPSKSQELIDYEIKKAEDALTKVKRSKETYIEKTAPGQIAQITNDRFDAFQKYPGLSNEELARECAKDPEEFIRTFKAGFAKLGPQQEIRFNHTIVFLTGNLDELVGDTVAEFRALKPSEQTPDKLHQMIREIPNQAEKMRAIFKSKIGSDDPLESRFQLSKWKFKLPLTSEQWKELVRRQLSIFARDFEDSFKESGRRIKLSIDESLINRLYDANVDPLAGPRDMLSNIPSDIGPFFSNLDDQLAKVSRKEVPKELVLSFDSKSGQIVAQTLADSGQTFRYAEKANIFKKTVSPLAEKNLRMRRKAHHIAGHAVVGMDVFGSLPERLTLELSPTEIGGDRLWKSIDPDLLGYKLNQVPMLLAGHYAQELVKEKGALLPDSEENMAKARVILKEIGSDTEARKALEAAVEPISDEALKAAGGSEEAIAKATRARLLKDTQEATQETPRRICDPGARAGRLARRAHSSDRREARSPGNSWLRRAS